MQMVSSSSENGSGLIDEDGVKRGAKIFEGSVLSTGFLVGDGGRVSKAAGDKKAISDGLMPGGVGRPLFVNMGKSPVKE